MDGDSLGGLDVNRVECFASFLHIQADGIDDPEGARHGDRDRGVFVHVGADRLDRRFPVGGPALLGMA